MTGIEKTLMRELREKQTLLMFALAGLEAHPEPGIGPIVSLAEEAELLATRIESGNVVAAFNKKDARADEIRRLDSMLDLPEPGQEPQS